MIEIKRILVPTDFSDPSAKALAYGSALARLFGSSLEVLHVIDAHPFAGTPDAAASAWRARNARAAFSSAVANSGISVT